MKKGLTSKKSILKAAGELFSKFGFVEVSMNDIAKSLNITKAALYYHFTNKKELYLKVLENQSQSLINKLNKLGVNIKSPEQRLSQAIHIYLKSGLKEKNLTKSIISPSLKMDPEIAKYIAKLREKINRYFQTSLKDMFQKKKLYPKSDLKFITFGLLGIMDKLIIEAISFNKKLGIKKKTSQILEIISPFLKGRS